MRKIINRLIYVSTFLSACTPSSKSLEKKVSETDIFLQKYTGKFVEPDFHESFTVFSNGSISNLKVRQVGGGSNSQVPNPTTFSYVMTGTISSVEKRSDTDKQKYMDFATHIIEVSYNNIALSNELEASTVNNSNCQTFLNEQNAKISAYGNITYDLYSELLNDQSFRLHSSGGGDYQNGGERTPSALDEIYSKAN